MDQIFDPLKEMFGDLLNSVISVGVIVFTLGIVVCAIGGAFGSQSSKEKFKSAFPTILGCFIVFLLARIIVSVVQSYF